MKRYFFSLSAIIIILMASSHVFAQKGNKSEDLITASDMESYISFLASPLLKGRMNGEEGLEIAAQYIASQAKLLGLRPANGNSYFQPYSVIKKRMDPEKTMVQIMSSPSDTITLKDQIFQLVPTGPSDFVVEGEVVFAGYGIKSEKYKYNDFDSLNTEGKILIVMERAPMSADGKKSLFEEPEWNSVMSFQLKLNALIGSKAKAILFVPDPKSGYNSLGESTPGIAGFLTSRVSFKGDKEQNANPFMAMMPKVIFVNRSVADALLEGSGHSLAELQKSIDESLKPSSFPITGKRINITEVSLNEEKILNNVAGYIEGSDPVLKNEVVVFSGHYDHIGGSGTKINRGADDDASGCAALLSMAEAFQGLKKKPLRTILFLWVSGEEIGLFGSKSYIDKPLFPLEKTVVDLNMDMIGRVKEAADSTSETPMTGPSSVFVITDSQSKDLRAIADEIDRKSVLNFDYSLSGRDHPLQLFARSDHYNFVKKDIPVLFFSTGIHSDYHTPGDVIEKIDFKKMELITRTMYEIGLTVANRKTRLIVDNPFSSWEKSK
jgi:Zn-dependent M28 family amino/carboxypeptidase